MPVQHRQLLGGGPQEGGRPGGEGEDGAVGVAAPQGVQHRGRVGPGGEGLGAAVASGHRHRRRAGPGGEGDHPGAHHLVQLASVHCGDPLGYQLQVGWIAAIGFRGLRRVREVRVGQPAVQANRRGREVQSGQLPVQGGHRSRLIALRADPGRLLHPSSVGPVDHGQLGQHQLAVPEAGPVRWSGVRVGAGPERETADQHRGRGRRRAVAADPGGQHGPGGRGGREPVRPGRLQHLHRAHRRHPSAGVGPEPQAAVEVVGGGVDGERVHPPVEAAGAHHHRPGRGPRRAGGPVEGPGHQGPLEVLGHQVGDHRSEAVQGVAQPRRVPAVPAPVALEQLDGVVDHAFDMGGVAHGQGGQLLRCHSLVHQGPGRGQHVDRGGVEPLDR